MTIPLYLAIAQWMLLLALGLLVFIMYRQLGHIFAGPTTAAEFGPAVGTGAASFEYTRVSDDTRHRFAAGDGRQHWWRSSIRPAPHARRWSAT